MALGVALLGGDPMTTAIPPAVMPLPSVILMFSKTKVLLEPPPARLTLTAPAPDEDEQFWKVPSWMMIEVFATYGACEWTLGGLTLTPPAPTAFITVSSLSVTAYIEVESMLSPGLFDPEHSKVPPWIVKPVLFTTAPQPRGPAHIW